MESPITFAEHSKLQDQEKLSSVKAQPPDDSESIVQDSVELDRRPQQAPQNSTVLDILEPSQPPNKDPAGQASIGSPIVLSKSQPEDGHDQDLNIIVQPVHYRDEFVLGGRGR